jgi:hypothetical protein
VKPNHYPSHVQTELDEYTQAIEYLTQQLAKTQDAIDNARERLSGGFQKDEEYHDMCATLDQLVAAKSTLERKFNSATLTLSDAKSWLDALPDDAVLEPVASTKPDGLDLGTVEHRIRDAEDEIQRLGAVPVPPSDIKSRVEAHVASLARPKVSGIASGQQLRVSWPSDTPALLAFLRPDEMTGALLQEIERQSNLADAAAATQATHRRAAGRDRHVATASLGARCGHQRTAACGGVGCQSCGGKEIARRLSGTSGDAVEPRCFTIRRGAGPVRRCPVLSKQRRTARGRELIPGAAGTFGKVIWPVIAKG